MRKLNLERIYSKLNTQRFMRKLDKKFISGMNMDPEEIKSLHDKYFEYIRNNIIKIDYTYIDLLEFVANVDSYADVIKSIEVIIKAQTLGLDEYIDFSTVIKILKKHFDPNFYFKLAKDFKNYKLEENNQGNFAKLRNYIDIPEKHLKNIVDVMLFTKNTGYPLSQKNIVKYYDSKRPETEDIFKLKDAWIFAHEHKINISIYDFIQAMKYEKDPLMFVINYNKIILNDIPISYEKFKILNIKQKKIEELINLLIKAKLANIYLDFETIYDDIKLDRDVWSIIRYLIKFQDSGFADFDYFSLRNYSVYGGNLSQLHNAYLLNRKNKIIDYKKLYKSALEILLVKNEKLNFNSFLMLKAIEFAKAEVPRISEDEVINDYLAGHDVFSILNYIKYARNHNVKISYNIAKALDKLPRGFKDIINEALNPMILKGEQVRVTTKDNIEITANIEIEAVIQLENFIKGSESDVLFSRANAIFIDEIQRKYNHDEIIVNIEKIANNILYRLNNESRERQYVYIPENKMRRITEQDSETEQNTEKGQQKATEASEEEFTSDFEHSKHNETLKFVDVSKYKPLKVLIPRINFEKDTFKDFDKVKEEFEIHKKKEQAKIEKIKAEIEVKRAWAKSKDLKYLILKDDEQKDEEEE